MQRDLFFLFITGKIKIPGTYYRVGNQCFTYIKMGEKLRSWSRPQNEQQTSKAKLQLNWPWLFALGRSFDLDDNVTTKFPWVCLLNSCAICECWTAVNSLFFARVALGDRLFLGHQLLPRATCRREPHGVVMSAGTWGLHTMPDSDCLFNSSENDSSRAGRGLESYRGETKLNCLIKLASR